jgi:hypothetical protein
MSSPVQHVLSLCSHDSYKNKILPVIAINNNIHIHDIHNRLEIGFKMYSQVSTALEIGKRKLIC